MQVINVNVQMQKQSHPYNLIAVHDEKGRILITNGTQKGKHSKPFHSTKYNETSHSVSVREIQKQKKSSTYEDKKQIKSKKRKCRNCLFQFATRCLCSNFIGTTNRFAIYPM